MAELSGELGAVYYNEEIASTGTTGTLHFSTGKTITSSGEDINFSSGNYSSGMLVTVAGCTTATGNNRIFTITAVTTGVLTVSETVASSSGAEAGAVTFTEAEPGLAVFGFYNWTLSYTGDVLETTDFDDATSGRSYIPGMTTWTATAEKHFLSGVRETEDWLGTAVEIRLYKNYVATPSTGTSSTSCPSQYYKGDTVVSGFDETTPVDALISQSISFQGDGALTLKTQTKAWNLGIST